MKPYLFLLCFSVPLLTAGAQDTPAPTVQAAQAQEPDLDCWIETEDDENGLRVFVVNFPAPIITEDKIGTTVQPGDYYRVEGDVPVKAEWISGSAYRVTAFEGKQRAIARFIVPDGLTALDGKVFKGQDMNIGNQRELDINRSSYYLNQEDKAIFYSAEEEELLEKAAEGAYFLYNRKDENGHTTTERMPAYPRHATIGDALENWSEFEDLFSWGDISAEDKKFMESKDPATELPGVWLLEFPEMPEGADYMEFNLPGLGHYDNRTKSFQDKDIASFRIREFEAVLTATRTDVGEYDIELHCSQPVADAEEIFRNAGWEMCAKYSKNYGPMVWNEQRQAFIGDSYEGTLALSLDKEATLEEAKDIKLPGGKVVKGTRVIHMKATTPEPGFRIRTYKPITSVYGKEYKENPNHRYDSFRYNMSTKLTPHNPKVYSDMLTSGLRGQGKRLIHCYIENAENVTARVYRISGAPEDVARLLIGYSQLYSHADHFTPSISHFIETSAEQPVNSSSNIGVPSILIPGRPEKAEAALTPDANGECTLDPASLFPGKDPHATYLVEIEAPLAQEAENGHSVLNQGVVQVTDLGLMWKLSAGRIFAYTYHLADGTKVPEATLHILDDLGREMAQLPVKDGISSGDLPKGARFLQVQAGDDRYTTRISNPADRMDDSCSEESYLLSYGINPAECMKLQHCIFTDRSIYRNGETAHVKGVLRFLQGNTLTIPELDGVEATVHFSSGEDKVLPADCAQDGSFCLDIPIDDSWYGYGSVEFKFKYKGDADGTAADMISAKACGVAGIPGYAQETYFEENRQATLDLVVEDFRRNEFEVTSTLEVDPETRTAKLTAEARDFNTAPVAHGKVVWSICAQRVNFYPKKFQDYYFGDYSEGPGSYFSAYYGNGCIDGLESVYESDSGALDENGKGEAELTINEFDTPGRYRVFSGVSVTNGNEQTLLSQRSTTVDSSAVYAGLGISDNIACAGTPIKMNAVLVSADGEAWDGAPLPVTLKVKRTSFTPYRYGTKLRSAIRNEKLEEEYPEQQIELGGTPTPLEIKTTSAGVYDITVQGKDAQGKPFYTTVRKYVWGDDVSPWEYENGASLELTADKDVYHAGDTAKILVQTPVDAELLVTVERDGVTRHYYRSVTVKNPVIEVPIAAEDAPVCRVAVFLVQGADERGDGGLPVLKNSFIELTVDMPEKRLGIQLETPQQAVTPTEECTVGGVVTDSAGNPVPNAQITLYAEDEGTLQVIGYTNPDLYDAFHTVRFIGVATFNTLGQLLGDFDHPDYGNKGIFVGGGDDDFGVGADPTADRGPRKDFNPCAIWLGRVTTDEQGRFSTTYTNPDTMTRYRVIAVATADADKFGTSVSSYLVAQPIMLEVSAPLTATENDCVDVPVTVTMLPKLMPAGAPEEVQWNVSLQAENASVPATVQSVTLNSDAPATIHFPVTVKEDGPVTLTWSVAPATVQPGMENLKDSVQLGFQAVPATPHLRLPLYTDIKPGTEVSPATLLDTKLRPDSKVGLAVSLSPLADAAMGVDYLFTYPYGCAEQLSSTLLPWLMADTLTKWVDVDFPKNQQADKVEKKTVNRLMERQLSSGAFGYWEGSTEASEFTPYVCFILSYSDYAMAKPAVTEKAASYIADQLKAEKDPDLLGLLALSRVNPTAAVLLMRDLRDKRTGWTLRDRLLFAYCMLECKEALGDAVQEGSPFATMLQEAVTAAEQAYASAKDLTDYSYYGVPVDALKLLLDIKTGKSGMEKDVRDYIHKTMARPGYHSTWKCAWACIVINEFCKGYEKQMGTPDAVVNGRKLEFGKPFRFSGKLKDLPVISTTGTSTVYISGVAAGYTVEPQKIQVVDKGFHVTRRYEKLMPDGTWAATGSFQVGDVVRVTVTADPTTANDGRYLVAEDRLPAGFEVVNPDLESQDLPDFISREPNRYWWFSGFVDHKEYHQDRVLFFASNFWGAKRIEGSYIARVVKSGRMTAPAAKVEQMYAPDIYGLSIPQEFTVKPRGN